MSNPKRIPICNYPGTGVVEMTSAKWKRTPNDYKGISTVMEGDVVFKVRRVMVNFGLSQVYLTDKPIIEPPKSDGGS